MSDQEDRRPTLSSINISFDCVIKLSFMTVHAVCSLYRPPKHLFPTILNAQLVSDRVTFRSQSGMFFLCLASGFFLRKPCLSCPFLVIFLLNLNFDHVRLYMRNHCVCQPIWGPHGNVWGSYSSSKM